MSRRPASQTVLNLAKRLAKTTDAPYIKCVRVAEKTADETTAPGKRFHRSLRKLQAAGYKITSVDVAASVTTGTSATRPNASANAIDTDQTGGSAPFGYEALMDPERQWYQSNRPSVAMKWAPSTIEPNSNGQYWEEELSHFNVAEWWDGGHSLGVYSPDPSILNTFVTQLARVFAYSVMPTVVITRQPQGLTPEIISVARDIFDLRRMPGGTAAALEHARRIGQDAKGVILMVDAATELTEEDIRTLLPVITRAQHVRVVHPRPYARRGESVFLDTLIDYGDTVLLTVDEMTRLEDLGLATGTLLPRRRGAGLYLANNIITPFGPSKNSSVYADAADWNEKWAPAGVQPYTGPHQPARHPFTLKVGDRLMFWTDPGMVWEVREVPYNGFATCVPVDSEDVSFTTVDLHKLIRHTLPLTQEITIFGNNQYENLETYDQLRQQHAVRLDLRLIERNGTVSWSDER